MGGEHTGKLGKKLADQLNSKSKYRVYYAHGNKKLDDGSVCNPTPFFDEYSNKSKLSFVDIVIVENDKVKLLCEIEESSAAPKKVIGDIVNILVSDKVRIQGNDYEYNSPKLILGLKVTEGGASNQKAHSLKQKLENIIKEPYWNLLNEIAIICDGNLDNLINTIEEKINELVNTQNT